MARPRKPLEERLQDEVKIYVKTVTRTRLEEYAAENLFDTVSHAARNIIEAHLNHIQKGESHGE